MNNEIEVESNEISLIVRHIPTDTVLEYDRRNDTVNLDTSVDYAVFVKLFKTLKREKLRNSFSEPEID